MKLTEDVHKIDGVMANAYLVIAEDGLTVIDTGMARSAKNVLAYIEGLGKKPGDVRRIVITHSDLDHIGGVAALKEATGAQVAIHRLDAPILSGQRGPRSRSPRRRVSGVILAVFFKLLRFRPVAADVLLDDGDVIGGLRVMHTPGHTAGSVTLVRDDGVVFSGDALLSDADGCVVQPRRDLATDYEQALASAEKIEALHPKLLLPGHGAPVTSVQPGRSAVTARIAHTRSS